MVGHAGQRGFGRMAGTESVLAWGQEVILGEVGVELLLYSSLHNFGNGRDDGNGTEIGRFGRIAGLKDRVNEGMLPGCRYVRNR